MRLKGKGAIVTGSGRGIGRQIALTFAREGAAVLISDIDEANAQRVAAEIEAAGGRALPMRADVSSPEDAQRMVDTAVNQFGRLDILVNNAGISVINRFVDTTLEDWERILKVNLTGTFLCGQAAARVMVQQQSGRIINIASLSGQRGGTGRAAYGSSKAGAELLMKVMAVELGELGINVNAIAPGPIDTEMCRIGHSQATREAYHNLVPQRRYGTEQEIADAAVFLASDEARYVNGHTLNVDGGFLSAGLMFKLNERLA